MEHKIFLVSPPPLQLTPTTTIGRLSIMAIMTADQLGQRITAIEELQLSRDETIQQMADAIREYLDQFRAMFAMRSAIRIANPDIELPKLSS